MLVAAFPEWSALIQHFTDSAIVLRRKTKNEQSPANLILSYLSNQPNSPKWACPSFRSESAILPWPVNHTRARAPKMATKQNAGTFSTGNRQQKKLRGECPGLIEKPEKITVGGGGEIN